MLRYVLAAAAVVSLAQVTFAESLTTAPANNAQKSIFLDLTAKDANLQITGFDTAVEGATSIQVYIREGSYVGFDNSSAGWTLVDTITATNLTGSGYNMTGSFALTDGIFIDAGQTVGICLVSTTGYDIQYTDSYDVAQRTWENDDLILFGDRSRSAAFGGTYYWPRTFSGTIYYDIMPVPEPGSLALLGLGAVACLRRRRRA